jgi:hypothetical protein
VVPVPRIALRAVEPERVFEKHLSAALRDMARFYLSLGGDESLRVPAGNARTTLEDAISALVMERMPEEIPDWLTLEIDHRYGLHRPWSLNVRLEPMSYFITKVDFLGRLKKRRPKFYRLVYQAIAIIASYCPVRTTADLMEEYMFHEHLLELESEGGENEELVDEIRGEYQSYIGHLKPGSAIRAEKIRPWVRRARRRLSGMRLKKKEKTWIECMLSLCDLVPEKFPIITGDELRYDDQEKIPLWEFFNLHWNDRGYVAEVTIDQTLSMAMEYGGPAVVLRVKEARDLERAARCIRFIDLLGTFFVQGDRLWNLKKR